MTNKLSKFEAALLAALEKDESVTEGVTHTPAQLQHRRRGRPPLDVVKVPVKLRLDADLLAVLRHSGAGWQTRVNAALRGQFMRPAAAVQTSSLTYVLEPARAREERVQASSMMAPYREMSAYAEGRSYAV